MVYWHYIFFLHSWGLFLVKKAVDFGRLWLCSVVLYLSDNVTRPSIQEWCVAFAVQLDRRLAEPHSSLSAVKERIFFPQLDGKSHFSEFTGNKYTNSFILDSNIEIIQRYQSKILRLLTNAPWYVTNHTLHSDLHIPYVREVFQERIAIHRTAISSHPNHGSTSTLGDHQTPKTTMDTRRDTLRKRRWTRP